MQRTSGSVRGVCLLGGEGECVEDVREIKSNYQKNERK